MSDIDPTTLTADEVQEALEGVDSEDELDDIFATEKDNDNRKTVKAAIASRKSELQNDSDDDEAAQDDTEDDSYSPPSARGNKERLEFELEEGEKFDEETLHDKILSAGPEDAVSYEEHASDTHDGTHYVVVSYIVPTEVTMNDAEEVEDEVGYSLSRRLAFAQELVDRSDSTDVSRIDYTDAPGAPDYEADSGVLEFTEDGLRSGQDRDHKTQWMHKVASIVGSAANVGIDTQLEVMGEIEYDGINATLGHFFPEEEETEEADEEAPTP